MKSSTRPMCASAAMKRTLLAAALACTAACDSGERQPAKAAATSAAAPRAASMQLQKLAADNATVLGFVYTADTPHIVATFDNGSLLWRTQGGANPVAQGVVGAINETDRSCIGFKQKNPTMPTRGPERFLICEATEPIKHSNSLPRSQDFVLSPGTLFLQYDPPSGTGFSQLFYGQRAK